MRKKSKNSRIDFSPRTTSVVKFSARSDCKNFTHKNRLSRDCVKSGNKFFLSYHHLKLLKKDLYYMELVLNFSFSYKSNFSFIYSYWVMSLTKSKSEFLKNLSILTKNFR
jgi:hypothetical protein